MLYKDCPPEIKKKKIAAALKWQKENPDRQKFIKRKRLFKKYSITIDDYNDLFVKQGGKCAICGIHQSDLNGVLCIDHCHDTNRVRGLLCTKCNMGIGYMQDDIENLKCAILYLNKSRQPL